MSKPPPYPPVSPCPHCEHPRIVRIRRREPTSTVRDLHCHRCGRYDRTRVDIRPDPLERFRLPDNALSGLTCPCCQSFHTSTYNTNQTPTTVERWHKCRNCHYQFRTFETKPQPKKQKAPPKTKK
jgi:hypothetical protein